MKTTENSKRFRVTISAGSKDGKRFGIWDSNSHKVVSWHRTSKQAQATARKMNESG